MLDSLPPGQTRVLRFFAEAELAGRMASRAECASHCGYQHPSATSKHTDALVRKGLMTSAPSKKRNLRLSDAGWQILGLDRPGEGVPVVGRIAAGVPILAAENREGRLDAVKAEPGRIALRIHGDSMIGAGILDGDYAIINTNRNRLRNGIISAVIIDDEATLKRIRLESETLILESANPHYQPRIINRASTRTVQVVGQLEFIVRNHF